MNNICLRVSGVALLAVLSLGATKQELLLIEAIKQPDINGVRALLSKDTANAAEADGTTALHWAVHRDDWAVVDLLIRAGADMNRTNRYGVTPLSLAAQNGEGAMIERLLKAGANPNLAIAAGETPLMTAARTGKVDAIRVLLAHGADVNAREHTRNQTALMWAAVANNGSAIRVLIEAGAQVNARSSTPAKIGAARRASTLPLEISNFTARERSFDSRAREPGAKVADPSAPAYGAYGALTALAFAARRGSLEAGKALLDGGANVNDAAVTLQGYGPTSVLTLAIENGHYEFAAFLLDRGADPNAAQQGWAPLHQLARARAEPGKTRYNGGWIVGPSLKGSVSGLDLARKLIAKGADVNSRATQEFQDFYRIQPSSRIGATPLLMAARVSDYELMKILLDAGADPTIATVDRVTPVMAAAGVVIRTAGEDGGDPDSPKALKLLLDTGRVDVNAADAGGWTPLHGAAYRGVLANIQLLVDAGANLEARAYKEGKARLSTDLGKTKEGWLPVDIADGIRVTWTSIFFRQPDAAVLLRKLMAERGLPVPPDGGIQRGAFVLTETTP